ncbi:MAG: hypothetical protein M3R67_12635, partial [Acidobacteriota bacterium]|nr:hypothetical protein [Acidobacteriota bacterium]
MQRITTLFIATLMAAVIVFPATSFSQTRKRTTTTKSSRSGAKPKAAGIQREGAARVAEEIKILTKFIYVLGGVAKGLESMDYAARSNEASSAILDQTKRNKESVRTSIQSVREQLDKLE